jgi:hypothetical protein
MLLLTFFKTCFMKKPMVFLSLLFFCIITFVQTFAQDDNDYSDNRGKKSKELNKAVNSNKQTPVKIIEYIVGRWQVENVYKGDKDISETDTLANDQRTMEFNRDGKYFLFSGKEQIDSGLYRLNEQQSKLYLESHGNGKPVEWNVTFRKNEMTLRNEQTSAKAEKIKYVYSRKSVKPLH